MKALLENAKETQTRMMQKVKDALHQSNDMRTQMEDAFTAKEAVRTVTHLLIITELYKLMFSSIAAAGCSTKSF